MATRRRTPGAQQRLRARPSTRRIGSGLDGAGRIRRLATGTDVAPDRKSLPSAELPALAFMRELRADHARQSRLLRKIDALAPGLRDQPEAVLPFLREALRYLMRYQHGYHHPREDLLFEAVRLQQPLLVGTMRELMHQHRAGQRTIERIVAALQDFPSTRGNKRAGARLARTLQEYAAHLRDHMRTEERVFYARAEAVLDEADWSALLAGEAPADPMADPMADPRRLSQEYPQIARLLAQPTTEVPRSGRRASARTRAWLPALRELLERRQLELADIVGASLHDTVELLQSDLALAGNFLSKGPKQALQELAAQHRRTLMRTWDRNARFVTGLLHELTAVTRGVTGAATIVDVANAQR